MNDFYVGYLPKAPTDLGRFLRRVIVGLGFLAVAAALLLLHGQRGFADSVFEFGKIRNFEGVIAAQPYPMLWVARPGQTTREDSYSQYLLVAPGKHGADNLVASLDGKRGHLRGQLIYRDGRTMVEVEPGSLSSAEPRTLSLNPARDLGQVTLTGEIVDSKCYLGVMNPGSGKVHRDCAARCLSGGIPPIFVSGDGQQYLLVAIDGHAFGQDSLREYVAERITIQGELLQQGDERMLRIDPQSVRYGQPEARQNQVRLK